MTGVQTCALPIFTVSDDEADIIHRAHAGAVSLAVNLDDIFENNSGHALGRGYGLAENVWGASQLLWEKI